MVFQELCHLLAIFLDCSSSPCRSLLISKPTLCKTILSSSFVLESCTKTDKLFSSSLEASTSKIQEVSTILVDHDFCQIAWLAWFNSGMRIKYDRTCQRSIKIVSIEKTFALHKSAQKKTFFPLIFFLKESSWLALFNHLKIANFEKLWFFTLDDTLNIPFKVDDMPNSSIQSILHLSIHLSYLEESFCLDTIYSVELPKMSAFLSDVSKASTTGAQRTSKL